jgi:HEAT repeat protein
MRKRVYIALAVLLVMLAGVIGWQGLREREPVYQGKRLSRWVKDYALVFRLPPNAAPSTPNADEAVRQIGTNAIPTLLRMLRAKDSPLKDKLVALAQRQHIIKIEYTPAEQWNGAAPFAFGVLGAKAQSAVPALIEIANRNISFDSQSSAIMALGFIGPSAKEAVPSLPGWATNANAEVREISIIGLGEIGAEPDRVVPALIHALHDPDAEVQGKAAWALGKLRPDAKVAVPALVEFLKDTRADEQADRLRAIEALGFIGPSAKEAVPSLLEWATNADPNVRHYAIEALGEIHAELGRVVPVLIRALQDPEPWVRPYATNALKAIDPEAAAKAGVK